MEGFVAVAYVVNIGCSKLLREPNKLNIVSHVRHGKKGHFRRNTIACLTVCSIRCFWFGYSAILIKKDLKTQKLLNMLWNTNLAQYTIFEHNCSVSVRSIGFTSLICAHLSKRVWKASCVGEMKSRSIIDIESDKLDKPYNCGFLILYCMITGTERHIRFKCNGPQQYSMTNRHLWGMR